MTLTQQVEGNEERRLPKHIWVQIWHSSVLGDDRSKSHQQGEEEECYTLDIYNGIESLILNKITHKFWPLNRCTFYKAPMCYKLNSQKK